MSGRHPFSAQIPPPGQPPPPETATEAGGTHTTGMHSCFQIIPFHSTDEHVIQKKLYNKSETSHYGCNKTFCYIFCFFTAWIPAIFVNRAYSDVSVDNDCNYSVSAPYVIVSCVLIYYIPIILMVYFYSMLYYKLKTLMGKSINSGNG